MKLIFKPLNIQSVKKESIIQVLLAIASGVTIGVLAAGQIYYSFLSIIVGAITGGISGYILCKPKEVAIAIPVVFRKTASKFSWFKIKECLVLAILAGSKSLIPGMFIGSLIAGIVGFFPIEIAHNSVMTRGDYMVFVMLVVPWIAYILFAFSSIAGYVIITIFLKDQSEDVEKERIVTATLVGEAQPLSTIRALLVYNPALIWSVLIYRMIANRYDIAKFTIMGLVIAFRGSIDILKTIGMFALFFIINLHHALYSKERVAATLWAAIGTVVAVCYHMNILLGIVFGMVMFLLGLLFEKFLNTSPLKTT